MSEDQEARDEMIELGAASELTHGLPRVESLEAPAVIDFYNKP